MEPDDRFQSCRALAVAARAALDTTPGVGVGSAYTSADSLPPDPTRLLAPGLASGSSGGRDGAASPSVLRFRTRSSRQNAGRSSICRARSTGRTS